MDHATHAGNGRHQPLGPAGAQVLGGYVRAPALGPGAGSPAATLLYPLPPVPVLRLRPVRSARLYLVSAPPAGDLVVPALADALEAVFERFARCVGATTAHPLRIRLARGFVPGSPGHGEGRAADIAAVGGRHLLDWKWDWDRVVAIAEQLPDPQRCAAVRDAERRRNLGHGLYRALLDHGGWRVDDRGWRPYRGVVQLFGPWTATEGPWKAMRLEDPTPLEQRRLADQRWVHAAHQDHIHVAR